LLLGIEQIRARGFDLAFEDRDLLFADSRIDPVARGARRCTPSRDPATRRGIGDAVRDFVGVMTNTAPTPLIAVPGIRRSSLWKTTMPSASIHLFDSNDPNKPVHSAVATSASWW
jgi:hypothetical protein